MKKAALFLTFLATVLNVSACSEKRPPNTVFSADDLQGAEIAVVEGSAAAFYAQGYGNLHQYETADAMLADLRNGAVDCAVMDESAAKQSLKKARGLRILPGHLVKEEFRFAIAKENPDLKEAVNSALVELSEDGTLEKIVDKYVLKKGDGYIPPENVDRSRGTLTLAVDAKCPPFSAPDGHGSACGLDVDVARAVCDRLGVDLEVMVVGTSELVRSVWYGKADFALGRLAKNDEDLKLVDFSEPYVECAQVIVVRK